MAAQQFSGQIPDDWVPVERRWLGIDRRTIWPSAIAILVIMVIAGVLPVIDSFLEYDTQAESGDVIDLGKGVTIAPPVRWGLENALLVGDETISGNEEVANLSATIVNGGLTVSIKTGPFDGTPEQLLEQINQQNEKFEIIDESQLLSETGTITLSNGMTGVAEAYEGVESKGIIAAFVLDGTGVEILITGPESEIEEHIDEIAAMINSLHLDSAGAGQ